MIKNIAILTSGGDAPGMNAAVRAVGKVALAKGIKLYGIKRGYYGMLNDEIFEMNSEHLCGIIDRGGTTLLTARCPEFKKPDVRAIAAENLKKRGIEGLVVIGGDGSFRGADLLFKEHDIKVIGIPGTIDNDIIGTDFTIGFDTCLNTILDAITKIRDTATSHERAILVEVMGRHAGDLALYASLAGGGDGLLIPEQDQDHAVEKLAKRIEKRRSLGKLHDIILVAEGVGSAIDIAQELRKMTDTDIRPIVLGHIQRGGTPSGFDRILATRMGAMAVDLLMNGTHGVMIGIKGTTLVTNEICYAWEGSRTLSEEDYQLALTLCN